MNTSLKEKISVPKKEYLRLKQLDERFGDFFAYIGNLLDIREARKEVKQNKVVSQKALFKKLGL